MFPDYTSTRTEGRLSFGLFKKIRPSMRQSQRGGCRIIAIFSQIKAFSKIKRSHIVNIGVYAYLRALIFENNEDMGEKGIIRQTPSEISKGCLVYHLETAADLDCGPLLSAARLPGRVPGHA
jgi:hypothetical protein